MKEENDVPRSVTRTCLLALPSSIPPHLPSLPKRICSFVDNGDNQTVFDKMARACGRRGERRDDSGSGTSSGDAAFETSAKLSKPSEARLGY